jgi:acetyl-CoA carboxylase biotin carboxylase subunit
VDLLREQILIAQGEPLREDFLRQRSEPNGHAIEVRLNAEDPETFAPSPGRITAIHLPGGPGVRLDTHAYQGYVVPPNYDSLIAKLIVHAEDRPQAVARLRRALLECVIEGIKTNVDFHRRVVDHEDFIRARLDTRFVERLTHQ